MKKLISLVISVILMLNIFCVLSGVAVSSLTSEGYEYEILKNGTAEITRYRYKDSATELVIPDKLYGIKVTSIGKNAFSDCTNLKSIAIPDSVKSIGYMAFYECKSLTSITIPDSVTSIGEFAFGRCLSLNSVTIPDSVTSIGGGAFVGCTSLSTIDVNNNNKYYSSLNGSLYNKSQTELIQYAIGKSDTSFTIPNSVTSIGKEAFYHCTSLDSVTIPDSVTSIGWETFYDTAYYNNPNNWENDVLYIGKHLIEAKDSLSGEYNIKSGTLTVADNAFSLCSSLNNITIPESVTSIGICAFVGCTSLSTIDVNNNNKYYSSLNGSLYNKSQTELIQYAIGKSDTSFTIPNSVTSIGGSAFYKCTRLNSVTIPDSVTSIGNSAFKGCAYLKYITIPNTINYIGTSAFYNCASLESISLPESVTKIYNFTFSGCNRLNCVFYNGYKSNLSIETLSGLLTSVKYTKGKGTFNGGEWYFDYTTGVLRITGNGNMEFGYSQTIPWSEYKYDIKSVVIESGITSIADYAFDCCANLSSVKIPNTVTNIGESAFEGCTSLKNFDLSSSVRAIGDNAFSNCTSLESITIPKCDSPLGQSAFSYCVNLKKVEIKNGLPIIESSAFYGCSSLKTISIPDSVESIGEGAFNDCKNLTLVTIGAGCKSISSKAFWDCPKLNKITVKYPNCIFNDSQYTISTTAIICGYKNSTAYTYARSYMRSFEDITTGVRYGWIDGSFIEITSKSNPTKLNLATPKVKITAGKKKLTVKYTKVKNATGFQVKYTYKGKTKTKTYTSKKSVTKIIKKLKKGTYKVSVRALIKSNGKTAYSKWTTAKKVKVK